MPLIRGFHDEALSGNWQRHRSSRLDDARKRDPGGGGKKQMALLGSVYSIAPSVRTPDSVLKALFAEKTSALKPPPTARPKPLHKAVRAGLIRDAEGHSERTRLYGDQAANNDRALPITA